MSPVLIKVNRAGVCRLHSAHCIRLSRQATAMQNVFVVGLEPFNLDLLRTIRGTDGYCFAPLLEYHDVARPPNGYRPFDELLDRARRQLDAQRGHVDAIIGYWDFPTTGLVALLRRDCGLPTATPEAVARCEHKYWSRLLQAEVVPDLIPRFQAIDPFAGDPLAGLELEFPFWIKPIKAHSSFLGFRVHNPRELSECLAITRKHIGRIAGIFNQFLAHVDVPAEIAVIDAHHCIAEQIISRGRQCTLEGYAFNGEIEVYGTVDSIRSGRHGSCFSRYQYPSRLPQRVQQRMIAATRRVLQHIGYDNAAFNIEFYWNPGDDSIRLLEINTRISKSHAPLFLMVDGASNQQIPVELALGRRPEFPTGAGDHDVAAKFMLRIHEDAIIERSPDGTDILALQARFPEARARVLAPAGTRLAHMSFQDSYSFEIAEIFLGAHSQKELLAKGREAERILGFSIRNIESEVA